MVNTKQAADISKLIQWANCNNATIVPLGGNTNLVRACDIEFTASNQASLIIYLRYTHRQLDYDPATKQITCSPNITMAELHDYCDSIHRRWDVHFSALSATIGGIMSTNAGGEQSKASKHLVALNIIDGLGKNQQLKADEHQTHSMIPKNGTATQGLCGFITSITLQTQPQWLDTCSAIAHVPLPDITAYRHHVNEVSQGQLVACELIDHECLDAQDKLTNETNPSSMMLLMKFATPHQQLDLDELWLSLAEHYPNIFDTMQLSTSQTQEEDFWHMRHDVSDANRRWAKSNDMRYIGYDIGVPKTALHNIIPIIREMLSSIDGRLFAFGHSMQSTSHDTMHINIALPSSSTLSQDALSKQLMTRLHTFDIQMAAEHGGLGNKSINDTLACLTTNEKQNLVSYLTKMDPHDTFRKDIKQKLRLSVLT